MAKNDLVEILKGFKDEKISLYINGCKLLPFGDNMLTLGDEHSPGYFKILFQNNCVYLIDFRSIVTYEMGFQDGKLWDIKWENHRLVFSK